MSEKTMKLANTMIIFNNSSDVMMTLFIIRERTIEQCHVKSAIFNLILFKTRVNRGRRDRKYDLCIKECLKRKQNIEVK